MKDFKVVFRIETWNETRQYSVCNLTLDQFQSGCFIYLITSIKALIPRYLKRRLLS